MVVVTLALTLASPNNTGCQEDPCNVMADHGSTDGLAWIRTTLYRWRCIRTYVYVWAKYHSICGYNPIVLKFLFAGIFLITSRQCHLCHPLQLARPRAHHNTYQQLSHLPAMTVNPTIEGQSALEEPRGCPRENLGWGDSWNGETYRDFKNCIAFLPCHGNAIAAAATATACWDDTSQQ